MVYLENDSQHTRAPLRNETEGSTRVTHIASSSKSNSSCGSGS